MEKDQLFSTVIEDMSEQGEGIGRVDGYTLFIKDALTGDAVTGKVIKAKKNYGYGKLISVDVPSVHRVPAACPIAAPCGGCQLMALSYEQQLAFKQKKVKDHLERIGGFEEGTYLLRPITGAEEQFRYRNKAQYPLGRAKDGRIVYGFYAGRTHSIIETDDCLICSGINGKIMSVITDFMTEYGIGPYDEASRSGLVRHVLIRRSMADGGTMVCIVANGKGLPREQQLCKRLAAIEGVVSVSLNINTRDTNVIMGQEMRHLYGTRCITEQVGDLKFNISPQSFFQVNTAQTKVLYDTVLELAGLTGSENVWDLYCGTGTIGLYLARHAAAVTGVEAVPSAVIDARGNARLNGIDNARFIMGKAEEVLTEYHEQGSCAHADVIVADPPRAGCDGALLKTILDMAPEKMVYVSCSSATLARDLKVLCEKDYELRIVQPVDMIPHCTGVETVSLLKRRV